VLVIDATLVIDPVPEVATTVSVNVPPAPLARLANVNVTLLVLVLSVPELATAPTSVNPAALSESVRVRLCAVLGPELPNAMT